MCAHCDGAGCTIYPARPSPCRAFECGWRMLDIIPESLRPDRSGVLILEDQDAPAGYARDTAVKFVVTGDASALSNRDVLESIAGFVHGRAPVFLATVGPPGYFFAKALLNPHLETAVMQRDGTAMVATLTALLGVLRRGPFEPYAPKD